MSTERTVRRGGGLLRGLDRRWLARGACGAGALATAAGAWAAWGQVSEARQGHGPLLWPALAALAVWGLGRAWGPRARLPRGATALVCLGAAAGWGWRWWRELSETTFSQVWVLRVAGLFLLLGAVLLTDLLAAGAQGRREEPVAGARTASPVLSVLAGAAACGVAVGAGAWGAGTSVLLEPEVLVRHDTAPAQHAVVDTATDGAGPAWSRQYPEGLVSLLAGEAGPVVVTEARVEALDGRTGAVRWTYTHGARTGGLGHSQQPGPLGNARLVDGRVELGCGVSLDAATGDVVERGGQRWVRPPSHELEGTVALGTQGPVSATLLLGDGAGSGSGSEARWHVPVDVEPYRVRPRLTSVVAEPAPGALVAAARLRLGTARADGSEAEATVVYGLR